MDSTLLAGLVGGASTIIAAVIALPRIRNSFLKKEKSRHYVKNPNRLKFIKGTWVGKTLQDVDATGNPMQINLSSKLNTTDNLIFGNTIVTWISGSETKTLNVLFEGGFVSENYIRILYQYDNGQIQNYGVMFLELEADGTTLKGNMIGYGHESRRIVTGTTVLKKQP